MCSSWTRCTSIECGHFAPQTRAGKTKKTTKTLFRFVRREQSKLISSQHKQRKTFYIRTHKTCVGHYSRTISIIDHHAINCNRASIISSSWAASISSWLQSIVVGIFVFVFFFRMLLAFVTQTILPVVFSSFILYTHTIIYTIRVFFSVCFIIYTHNNNKKRYTHKHRHTQTVGFRSVADYEIRWTTKQIHNTWTARRVLLL